VAVLWSLGCQGSGALALCAALLSPQLGLAQSVKNDRERDVRVSAKMLDKDGGAGSQTAGSVGARIVAEIDIAAPPQIVWQAMTDCARAPAFVPGLKACRVLQVDPGGVSDVREHRVKFTTLLPHITMQFRSEYRPFEEIKFTTQGVGANQRPLTTSSGRWTLSSENGGRATKVSYDVELRTSLPAPRILLQNGLRRDIPAVLLALRSEAIRLQSLK
jgi:uncharacterized protein YndB with AHSA1/START domain